MKFYVQDGVYLNLGSERSQIMKLLSLDLVFNLNFGL